MSARLLAAIELDLIKLWHEDCAGLKSPDC